MSLWKKTPGPSERFGEVAATAAARPKAARPRAGPPTVVLTPALTRAARPPRAAAGRRPACPPAARCAPRCRPRGPGRSGRRWRGRGPVPIALAVWNGSNIRRCSSAADAAPLVADREHDVVRPRAAGRARAGRRSGIASSALRVRFQKTCLIWSGSARHTCGPASASKWTVVVRPQLRRVAQEGDRLLHQRAQVHRALRAPGRAHLVEEPVQRVAEPLRLAGDDVQEPALLVPEPGLRHQHLGRAPDGAEGVADLVGELRRHLPHRGQLLLGADLLLEAPDVGEVLEDDQVAAGRAFLGGEGRHRDAELEPSPVGVPVGELEAGERPARGAGPELRRRRAAATPALHEPRVPRRLAERPPEDRLAELVHVEDPALGVGGHEPALDAVDDHLVELAQVGDLDRRLAQLLARALEALGEVGAEDGHGDAGDAEHEDRVDERPRGQRDHVGEALRRAPARRARRAARPRRGRSPPRRG